MSRTRGVSQNFVALDRQGRPISPAAMYLQKAQKLNGDTMLRGPGAEVVAPPLPIVAYEATMKSLARNLEAYDLALLLDAAFRWCPEILTTGLVVRATPEQFATLPGDARRHFAPVRGQP